MKKMLCMILKGYPRISESFISGEIAQLERRGLLVRLFSMRTPRESFAHRSVAAIRAGVVYLPEEPASGLPTLLWRALRVAVGRPIRFRAGLAQLGRRLAVSARPLATIRHFLQGCWLAEELAAIPEEEGTPGHLHAHFAHSPASVALYASILSGLPFSFTAHAKDVWSQAPESLSAKMAWARFVITCSEHNRRYLESLNSRGTPLFRVYHGVDLKLFSYVARPDAASPPYVILTVARLVPKKGVATTLRALRLLADQGVDFRYRLVGSGEQEAELKALARELDLEDRVRFLGVQPHEKVLEELARADVFVLACEVAEDGDRDGAPNVIVEAMARGTPVVSTLVSAVPELIEHGQEGLLVPERQPDALAQALRRLLTDADLRGRVRPAARRKAETLFDADRNGQALADLFRNWANLIDEPAPAPGPAEPAPVPADQGAAGVVG